MIARCNKPSKQSYHRYGGRGIKVCDRWLGRDGLANFIADMGPRPSPKHSVDRIKNDGNYEPGNCRWATQKEQQRNRCNNRLVTAYGVTKTLIEWSEEFGVPYFTIWYRLSFGWPTEKAVSAPPRKTRKV